MQGRVVEILQFEIRVSEEGLGFCRVCGLRILGRTAGKKELQEGVLECRPALETSSDEIGEGEREALT